MGVYGVIIMTSGMWKFDLMYTGLGDCYRA